MRQARTVSLGGEIDLKYLFQLIFRDAVPGIGDFNPQAFIISLGLEHQIPAFWHGVFGVNDEVQERLFQVVGIHLDFWQSRLITG